MHIDDRDIHAERRRIFWQRAYLQTLDQLVQQGTSLIVVAERAGDVARLAADQFDQWEKDHGGLSGATENPNPTPSDASDSPDDDPDGGYLGR